MLLRVHRRRERRRVFALLAVRRVPPRASLPVAFSAVRGAGRLRPPGTSAAGSYDILHVFKREIRYYRVER